VTQTPVASSGAVMSRPTGRSRSQRLDLLRPYGLNKVEIWGTALIVDPRAQLREITDLVERGFMSLDEFERQRRKIADA
jgi:hypothetical protein